MSEKAIDLFKQIKEPDDVIITLLFKACAQLPSEKSVNLVKDTWQQYRAKVLRSKNTLTSLIDALMKCGDVNKSEVVFSESREKSISMYATMMKGILFFHCFHMNLSSSEIFQVILKINYPKKRLIFSNKSKIRMKFSSHSCSMLALNYHQDNR